ncbi:MAG: hypothetical protein KDD40_02790 [Bdellovibrionales bacterium]|nr:hypothetical protein [Bdellovibrionales bacterium]
MKKSISILTMLASLLLISACGKDKKGDASPRAGTPAPTVPGINTSDVYGTYSGKYSWAGDLHIEDRKLYKEYLSDHGICDLPNMWISFGWANCDNIDGLYVSVHFNELKASTFGYAQLWNYYGYWQVVPNTVLNGEFAPIDQDTGMEIYRSGYIGHPTYNKIFRYRIYNNVAKNSKLDLKVKNSYFIELKYKEKVFATATLYPDTY